jgi:hypothetical protein
VVPPGFGSPVATGERERSAFPRSIPGGKLMSRMHPVAGSARQRARDHQRATSKAVAAVEAAAGREEAVQTKRLEVITAQDALVAAAKADLASAVAGLVVVVGVDVAAELLDLPKAEVRRMVTARDEVAS